MSTTLPFQSTRTPRHSRSPKNVVLRDKGEAFVANVWKKELANVRNSAALAKDDAAMLANTLKRDRNVSSAQLVSATMLVAQTVPLRRFRKFWATLGFTFAAENNAPVLPLDNALRLETAAEQAANPAQLEVALSHDKVTLAQVETAIECTLRQLAATETYLDSLYAKRRAMQPLQLVRGNVA